MDLTLKGRSFERAGVFGQITSQDGSCIVIPATLEHSYESQVNPGTFISKIPPGSYTCIRSLHRLPWRGSDQDPFITAIGARVVGEGLLRMIEFETFMITGVDGHQNLLFHWGNKNDDSEGCVLCGAYRAGDEIMNSRYTFQRFMQLQYGVNQFDLEVV